MKAPKYPQKPYPPYKPAPPAPMVDVNKNIDTVQVDTYNLYTLEEFAALIKGRAKDLDPKDIKFEFEVQKEWCYDDCTTTIVANIIHQTQIPNPQLAKLTEMYESNLKKYHEDYEKYKKAQKKYDEDYAAYLVESDKYQLERSKILVKKLEKKLKVKK